MFVVLVIIQVMILNQVQFSGYVNPYIYILFVMLLPTNSPRYLQLLLAFLIGFIMDVFSNSLGIHTFATVLIAFIRPSVIKTISIGDERKSEFPGMKQNSVLWFLYYSLITVFIHHFILFNLEIFSLTHFFGTLLRIFASTIFSVFILVLSQFLIFRE